MTTIAYNLTIEEQQEIRALLTEPREKNPERAARFDEALRYSLEKNKELLRRLA